MEACAPCSIDGWADRSARERGREGARWGGDGRREGVEARRKRKKWWGWTVLALPSPLPPLRASASSLLFSTKSKLVEQWTTPISRDVLFLAVRFASSSKASVRFDPDRPGTRPIPRGLERSVFIPCLHRNHRSVRSSPAWKQARNGISPP